MLAAEAFGNDANPSVLLVHGGGQSKRSFRAAAEALAQAGRYAISLDLRGHGQSAWAADGRYQLEAFAEDLALVLASLPRRPAVVAAALGGMATVVALGEAASDLASALVLVDTAASFDPTEGERLTGLLRAQGEGFTSVEQASAAAAAINPRRARENLASLESRLVRRDDGKLRWEWDPAFLDGFGSVDTSARVAAAAAKLKLPTLVVRGSDSVLVTREAVDALCKSIAGAEMVEIEGAEHMVVIERPDAFNAALLEFLERRSPRSPLSYEQGSDSRTLRDALGCFATGVTVVTTVDEGGVPVGLTVNSFTSVSLEPPLILFCLARSSSAVGVFEKAGRFGVNVLHIGQQPTSDRFAKRSADRFSATDCETWSLGVPMIRGSLASIECQTHAIHDGGDHLIMIGRVVRAAFEPMRDPLLYFRGRYRRLHFA